MIKKYRAFLIGCVLAIGAVSLRSTQETSAESHAPAPAFPPTEQREVLTTSPAGLSTWHYRSAFAAGVVPVITAVAVSAAGSADVINVQLDGQPTNTDAKFRVTRTLQSQVAPPGPTLLSVPGEPGPTLLHVTARAP